MNRIKEIEKILKDEVLFNNYIEKIEKLNIDVPNDLESNIISKLELHSKKEIEDETKVYKFKIQDILKIVACTIFAVTMWQFTLSKSFATYSLDEQKNNQEKIEIYDKVDNLMKSMNGFFMNPINLKGESE